jgi:hypothetical protein
LVTPRVVECTEHPEHVGSVQRRFLQHASLLSCPRSAANWIFSSTFSNANGLAANTVARRAFLAFSSLTTSLMGPRDVTLAVKDFYEANPDFSVPNLSIRTVPNATLWTCLRSKLQPMPCSCAALLVPVDRKPCLRSKLQPMPCSCAALLVPVDRKPCLRSKLQPVDRKPELSVPFSGRERQ